MLSGECHRTPWWEVDIQWLVSVRWQAITWANVDPDLCHHMASPGHELLHQSWLTHIYISKLYLYWFRKWGGAKKVTRHYPNQCWVIVKWALKNKLQRNFNQYMRIFSRQCIWKCCLQNDNHFVLASMYLTLKHRETHECIVSTVATDALVLKPNGTKPLPEPMLTSREWGSVAFTWERFHSQCLNYYSLYWVCKLYLWNYFHISQWPMS